MPRGHRQRRRRRRRRRRSRPADGRSSTWSTSPAARSACAPNTRRTHRASTASFSMRRRAVVVDVADLLERPARALERQLHRADDLACRPDPSARDGTRRTSIRSRRRSRRSARRARARGPRARASSATRPRRARSRRGRDRTAATPRRADRCSCVDDDAHAAEPEDHARASTHASAPPVISTSASPCRISAAA